MGGALKAPHACHNLQIVLRPLNRTAPLPPTFHFPHQRQRRGGCRWCKKKIKMTPWKKKKNQHLHRVLSLPNSLCKFPFLRDARGLMLWMFKTIIITQVEKKIKIKYYLIGKNLDLSAHCNSFNATIRTSRVEFELGVLYKNTHTRKSNTYNRGSSTCLPYYIHTFKWNLTGLLHVFWSTHERWLFLNSLSYWASLFCFFCAGHLHWHDNIGFSFADGRRPGPL